MSNTRDSVSSGYMYPKNQKRVENLDETRSVWIKYETLSREIYSQKLRSKQRGIVVIASALSTGLTNDETRVTLKSFRLSN